MQWVGKLIGGAVGFALGGPWGAVAGAAVGYAYDAGALSVGSEASSSEVGKMPPGFYVPAFSMLAKLVHVDGGASQQEIDTIESFMAEVLELGPKTRNLAVKSYRSALGSEKSFQDFALAYDHHFHDHPYMLEFMLEVLVQVAVSDGGLKKDEERLIRSAVDIFHISDDAYQGIKSKYVSPLDQAYAVLESGPEDSPETIKQRYRRLVADYHPDKMASKQLPETFMQFAQDKFREIQNAYEAIRHDRGF